MELPRSEFAAAREQTDKLFRYLNPESLYDRPIAERHRMIFYLGHLEAFDWNLLQHAGVTGKSIRPEFDRLFAFGIDPEPGQLPSDQPGDWPSRAEVSAYGDWVRQTVDVQLGSLPTDVSEMMLEHRHMHAETFAYILHNLDYAKKQGPRDTVDAMVPPLLRMIEIPAGCATLGRPLQGGFGWDNEYDEFSQQVPAFEASRYKTTNAEFLAFMQATSASAPHYWAKRGNAWFYRGIFEEFPLPLDWPVYATLEQARAYSAWRGMALPTEPQYHRMAFGSPNGPEHSLPWTDTATQHGNFDYRRFEPVPVHATPEADSPYGIAQTMGNGWEWTDTVFGPFPGFAPRAAYPGYSANFFDGQHYVMKGASPRTSSKLVRRSLRNWFRPDYPYVYGTFRLVQN